jgi:hypothetical protein
MMNLMASANQADLQFISKLAEEHKLNPVIQQTFTLDDVPEALNKMGTGGMTGKLVITNLEKAVAGFFRSSPVIFTYFKENRICVPGVSYAQTLLFFSRSNNVCHSSPFQNILFLP